MMDLMTLMLLAKHAKLHKDHRPPGPPIPSEEELAEYELINKKESKLSSNERKYIKTKVDRYLEFQQRLYLESKEQT